MKRIELNLILTFAVLISGCTAHSQVKLQDEQIKNMYRNVIEINLETGEVVAQGITNNEVNAGD